MPHAAVPFFDKKTYYAASCRFLAPSGTLTVTELSGG